MSDSSITCLYVYINIYMQLTSLGVVDIKNNSSPLKGSKRKLIYLGATLSDHSLKIELDYP